MNMYKYKKIIYVFLIIVLISAAAMIVILSIKETDVEQSMQDEVSFLYADKIEIYSPEDYLEFAASVNSGVDYQNCEVSLQADLDFSGYDNLIPIGTVGENGSSFLGVFNGNGYTISGVTMECPGEYVGLFVNLGGIVKNLQVKDCMFSGEVCGVVATDTVDASILNCCVDVQVYGSFAGSVVGVANGRLSNCVTSSDEFVGELQDGQIDHCYQSSSVEIGELNNNLAHMSGYYEDTDFCVWENGCLSPQKADLMETLTARLNVKGEELKLLGYYSKEKQRWCFTLPAIYDSEEVFLEVRTCQGGYQEFAGKLEDEITIFTWEDRYYPIKFQSEQNIPSIYVTLPQSKDLDYIHENKTEEIPGMLTVLDSNGEIAHIEMKGFYGHGNDSWLVEKKSYNLKLESYNNLLNMGANEDFVFISGYRNDSLMSYVATAELVRGVGFAYAPEFRLVNLYIAGEYAGVYFLVEKIELDKNRIEIESVYENTKTINVATLENSDFCSGLDEGGVFERYYYDVKNNPEDITGGYLLEADTMDFSAFDSRFVSKYGSKLTLKRARYSSREQANYIADYWQEFEDALYAEDGYNQSGKHYSEYIDVESFAMQWLFYELAQDISLYSSIYFYKESDITGDGLLHACFPWDVEHSYLEKRLSEDLWLIDHVPSEKYWVQIYQHEDFRKELCEVWNSKYVPAIQRLIGDEPMEYEDGMKNLSWYQENIVGIHYLENSRWGNSFLWNRCGQIRDFIEIRSNALSRHLNLR